MSEPKAYQWLTGTLEAARDSLKMTAECLAATSALVQAISERFPEVGPRYEELRTASLATAPRIQEALQNAQRCDQIIQRFREADARGEL